MRPFCYTRDMITLTFSNDKGVQRTEQFDTPADAEARIKELYEHDAKILHPELFNSETTLQGISDADVAKYANELIKS